MYYEDRIQRKRIGENLREVERTQVLVFIYVELVTFDFVE